ncbi:hypothetical protein KFE25_001936 [Diacronema lutheri]|uniref:Formamidopyrimidine-DNA glycosylase catalytic domain-containing protein n=1 Tax=Diacronema lutheri TaxID=2081491 RepID=A0A8J5XVG9_DIALT|nr:hypothetical protein KFE25_001936 [Diacronema lutheri]
MPELPEVEAQRAMLERSCVGMRVRALTTVEQGGGGRDGLFDDKVIAEGLTAERLTSALVGLWVLAARRRGKQMWLELGASRDAKTAISNLLIHLGMTGAVLARGGEGPKYKRLTIDATVWPPKFTKLELSLADETGCTCSLAYTDSRRFGRILLREGDATLSPPILALAADPILNPPSAEEFARMLARPTTSIKAALLDQSRLVCGVGNWVADEVLYQARILPSAPCNALSAEQCAALHATLIDVCTTACKANADSSLFPPAWLFHHRWANQTTGSISSPLGRICFDTVGGRTTAFLPHVQKPGARESLGAHGAAGRGGAQAPVPRGAHMPSKGIRAQSAPASGNTAEPRARARRAPPVTDPAEQRVGGNDGASPAMLEAALPDGRAVAAGNMAATTSRPRAAGRKAASSRAAGGKAVDDGEAAVDTPLPSLPAKRRAQARKADIPDAAPPRKRARRTA